LYNEIKNHRLGAFIYGFIGGLGLVLMIWGLAFITMQPSTSVLSNIGLIFLGLFLFAGGCCREAYLRGSLSVQSSVSARSLKKRVLPTMSTINEQKQNDVDQLTTEQISDYPIETEVDEVVA
jgi:hypothetical protein